MKEKYIIIKDLSISEKLLNFVNNELLPGTKVNKENFWDGFNKYVHELVPRNKTLLETREKLQKTIDDWHKDNKGEKFDLKKYTQFLKKIGYLKKKRKKILYKNKKYRRRNNKNLWSSTCGTNLKCEICS
jgi:malate synthase